MNSFHGHEVMRMMVESGRGWTRASLEQAIVDRFGADARFHTCSAQDMTPAQLIDFLAARGKFVETPEGFTTEPDRICDH